MHPTTTARIAHQAMRSIDKAVLTAAKIDKNTKLSHFVSEAMQSNDHKSALQTAIDLGDYEMAKTISAYMASHQVKENPFESRLRLEQAIIDNNVKLVQFLIDNGVELENIVIEGLPAFHYAALHAQPEMVVYLSQVSDINKKTKAGNTALNLAAGIDNSNLAILLGLDGIEIDSPGEFGETPLHRAVRSGQFSHMRTLLRNEADMNIQNQNGETPFHLLCGLEPDPSRWECKCSMIQEFLSLGADNRIENIDGARPSDM